MAPVHKVDTKTQWLGYEAKALMRSSVAKEALFVLNGEQATFWTATAGGIFAALPQSLGVTMVMGLTAALGAGIAQMDYNHKRESVKRLYEDELEAKLGKPAAALTNKDLERIAKGDAAGGIQANKTIADSLSRAKKERNLGIVLATAATLATLTALSIFIAPVFEPLVMAPWMKLGAKMAIGALVYHAVKEPLRWATEKLFGLDKEATHDKIVKLEKAHEHSKAITREQVMSVFASANPDLQEVIKIRHGKPFDALKSRTRKQIADAISDQLDPLVADLNSGRVNVTELAFIVEGQSSGVAPKDALPQEPKKAGLLDSVRTGLTKVADHFKHHKDVPQPADMPDATAISHVERLEQSRASQAHIQQR